MRAAIRLLLALTLAGWGRSASCTARLIILLLPCAVLFTAEAQAANYIWYQSYYQRFGASPGELCGRLESLPGGWAYTSTSQTQAQCYGTNGQLLSHTNMVRQGDSCPAGKVWNAEQGACVTPVDCTNKPPIYAAVQCTYVSSSKLFSCPTSINNNGCSFNTSPDGNTRCDISTSICVGRYSPTGDPAQEGDEECTAESCADLPNDPGQAPENCITNGGNTYCFEDQESGCGTFNGKEGCFETDQGCGTFNGTWGCYGTDQDSRNCGYANGERVCFNPDNPTEQIPPTSPDHPNNGGNADGNENNDPTAPGSTGGSSQGADDGATNESIDELGELLGPKIDKTNSLLDGIGDTLSEISDGLFGDEYNDSQVGTADGIKADAQGFGQQLGDMLTEQGGELISQRDAEAKTSLEDEIPKAIGGPNGMFGENSLAAGALDILNDVLPTATGCMDYPIDFELGDYDSQLILPVCQMTRLKPLLEYVIWIITVIGLWKILYSGLRLEDAKASKGGY